MQASARVARFLADTLGCMLVDDEDSLWRFLALEDGVPGYGPRRHTVIFVNGPIAFCGFRDIMGTALLPITERVFWVQQDYTITLPPNKAYSRPTDAETPFRKEFHAVPHVHLWSTCQDVLGRRQNRQVPGCEMDEYVNWNALTYAPMPDTWHQVAERDSEIAHQVFYYGALREGRKPALKRFFGEMDPARVSISVSNLNKRTEAQWSEVIGTDRVLTPPVRFDDHPPVTNGNRWGQQAILEEIAMHAHSLYIADEESNVHFHSLANRFYEVLSTPLTVLWLDAAGTRTYRAAGLRNWERYVVDTSTELQNNVEYFWRYPKKLYKLAEDQRADFLITDPFKALLAQVRELKKALS